MLTLNNYNLAVKEIYLQLNLHTDIIVICCINDFYFIFIYTVDVSLIYTNNNAGIYCEQIIYFFSYEVEQNDGCLLKIAGSASYQVTAHR